MANFLRFTDIPIFANFSNTGVPNTSVNGRLDFMAASDATLSFENQLEPQKFLGKAAIPTDFRHTGPLQSKLSFTYMPLIGESASRIISQTGLLGATGDSTNGYQIKVGSFVLKRCFLNSYSIRISPYAPIQISAEFQSFDTQSIEGTTFSGFSTPTNILSFAPSGTYMETAHALATKFSGQGVSLPQAKTEINISCNCQRNPVYTLGNQTVDTVILNSVERTTTINGENVGQIIEFDGGTGIGYLKLDFYPFKSLVTGDFDNLSSPAMCVTISGKVLNQNLTIQPNQTVQGSVSIKENLF